MIRGIDEHIEPWTKRIVRGEASLTDVPDGNVSHIAREVKAYADHYPDIGESSILRRLRAELAAVEGTPNEAD